MKICGVFGFYGVKIASFVLRCKLGLLRRLTQNKGTRFWCTLRESSVFVVEGGCCK